jgi:hypothetical protein
MLNDLLGGYLDWIAWVVVTVFYLGAVMPIIGDEVTGGGHGYVESLMIGAVIHVTLVVIVGCLLIVTWAVIHLTA